MSYTIRVDIEVYSLLIQTQARLMQATGHHVSASDAVAFLLALKGGQR